MARIIEPGKDETHLDGAVEVFRRAGTAAALTGAGISVESGIPDFRSPGGLWSVFSPEEYATIEAFHCDPAKSWRLFRAVGEAVDGALPNPAHEALARLEEAGLLEAVVTQNVDGLHQSAGSRRVIEVHGEHRHLQCLRCDWLGPVLPEHADPAVAVVPTCPECGFPLKPNVVLFGEMVRGLDSATEILRRCGALLVIGTSAQIYPSAGLPGLVQANGGKILEFNTEATDLTAGRGHRGSDYLFLGPAARTVSAFAEAALAAG